MKIQILRCKTFCVLSVFVLFGLIFSGCAAMPEIINLKQDENFTHDEIVAGMMGVGGVVSIANDLDESESRKYAGLLKDSFQSARKELVILPVEEVVRWIGNDDYQTIFHNYKYTGNLNLDFLKNQTSQAAFRYLLLARIIENDVSETSKRCPRPEIPTQFDLKGNPIIKEIAVELISTRRIDVSLDIYDLKKKILVFSGIINESKSKTRTAYYEKKDEGIGRTFALIPVRAFLEVALKPSAPSTDELLHKIFKAFARYIP